MSPDQRPRKRRGIVYLIGAGPGDPGLLTLKARDLLQQADLVLYDHLVSPRILQHCPPGATRRYVGKEASRHAIAQASLNRLLVQTARAGKTVVRLKGGDPFLFGRGGEEALALARAGVRFEIVPGVTSALAVPAYAGIPVTHRDHASSVAILTGHEDPTKPAGRLGRDRWATACDTLVCLMGVSTLPGITAQLMRHGRSPATPCAVIEWGTTPRQRTVTGTLRTMASRAARAHLTPPAIFVVGNVVSLRPALRWFETKPLFGKRILVTRAAEKADALASQLERLGAEITELPAIELAPPTDRRGLQAVLRDPAKPAWVFFTSPEGIGWFARLLVGLRADLRWLAGCHIGAIGPKTADAVRARGIHVDFIPRRFSQEGLVEDFPRRAMAGQRALILSAAGSRDVLERGLRARGMRVTKIPIYRTILPRALTRGIVEALAQPLDLVTATSASCVEHVVEAMAAAGLRRRCATLRWASIGPVTSTAIRRCGGRVAVEASISTMEGLVDALVKGARA